MDNNLLSNKKDIEMKDIEIKNLYYINEKKEPDSTPIHLSPSKKDIGRIIYKRYKKKRNNIKNKKIIKRLKKIIIQKD